MSSRRVRPANVPRAHPVRLPASGSSHSPPLFAAGPSISLPRPAREAVRPPNVEVLCCALPPSPPAPPPQGPIVAEAIFLNREELPVYPVYFDPVHDFAFLRWVEVWSITL
jgi:hypothetical protein